MNRPTARYLSLLLVLTLPLLSQVTGKISGVITDQSGALVPGANVTLSLAGGARPVAEAQTNSQGVFAFPSIPANPYDVAVEKQGFLRHVTRGVKVDPGKETSMTEIRLDVSSLAETVEVSAATSSVQTATAEVSATITNSEINRLPLLNRTVTNLLFNQPGVNNGRGPTTVNGMRSSYANMSLDGVNIQDNFIRQDSISFSPNLLLIDQISEITVTSSNGSAVSPGGGSQFTFTSRSGTNLFHGSALWYNRNNLFASADWFDNRNKLPKSFLNQNQFGGGMGGPIKKDKLFFYGYAEAVRSRTQIGRVRTILTDSARNGVFTYRDSAGNVQRPNLLQLRQVGVDPVIQGILANVPAGSAANTFQVGDSSAALQRNTIGYAFQAGNNRDRNNTLGKLDYILSTKHSLAATYAFNNDKINRSDAFRDYNVKPVVNNEDHSHMFSAAWRSNPIPAMVNELRGGFNLAPILFINSSARPAFYVEGLSFDNSVNGYDNQGRTSNTYNLSNMTTWFRGRHNLQFGYQLQKVRVESINQFDVIPRFVVGMGRGQNPLTSAELPGINGQELAQANMLLASLGGFVEEYRQRFNVTTRTSGFANGASNTRNYQLDNHAFFLQDQFKATRRLTVNAGMRWEYQTPMRERDSLYLLPKLIDNNYIRTLAENATLEFAGNKDTLDLYKRDFNNFGPNIGIAWDVFGTGRTAIRAGYAMFFVNDSILTAIDNSAGTNRGLVADANAVGQSGRLSTGRPSVPVPALKVPRTYADNLLLDPAGNAGGMPDPGMVTPYVQQWNFAIQQEYKGTIFEVRYLGTKSTKQLRALDLNQIDIKAGGFLDDFKRARANGFASRASGRSFNPAYNAAVPGSQPLPVFDRIQSGGLLSNGTVQGYIERGEVAQLAHVYVTSGFAIPFNFYRNTSLYGANVMLNLANTSYHSLQIDVRHRFKNGLAFNTNYAFSKSLSDALGDGQTLFEPYLDSNNPKLERARSPFDIRHNWKANFIYELPIQRLAGGRLAGGSWKRATSGWSVSGLMFWQSGTPFSVLAPRGTLNRTGTRSNSQTASSSLTGEALQSALGFFMTGNGPLFVDPRYLGPDGRAVGADGTTFANQVFFNPEPGGTGSLQRRMFSGPSVFSFDAGLHKSTRLTDRVSVELRMDAANVLNHPTFDIGDESALTTRFNVNNPTFGNIVTTFTGRRAIQFGMYLRF